MAHEAPLTPATIAFDDEGLPTAPAFGDRYHARVGADVQAREVFLAGCGLPERWRGRRRFVVLETGFGLGNNFLATWQAWREDPARCEWLHFVAIDAHPPTVEDLARCHAPSPWPELAQALVAAWPGPVAGMHRLGLDRGRVELLLAFGEVVAMLRGLDLSADAVYLDGFAPARNPAMWRPEVFRALARLVAADATAATWSVARVVQDGLNSAGFEVRRHPGPGAKREVTRACRATRAPAARRVAGAWSAARPGTASREVAIVGAGLAGAWSAWAMARAGWTCQVFERHAAPAREASGNPAGLFHPTVHADDSVHAALLRAASAEATRVLSPWIRAGELPGAVDGLLRVERAGEPRPQPAGAASPGRAQGSGQAVWLPRALASQQAGCELPRPAWWFAQAGWVAPAALVHRLLGTPGVSLRVGQDVCRVEPSGARWRLLAADGSNLGEADAVVLANAAGLNSLWPQAAWPLARSRGQVSWWQQAPPQAPVPRLPLAGQGYAIALPGAGLLFGATAAIDDDDRTLRERDHRFNLDRLAGLTGWQGGAERPWQGRVGWRVSPPDRLPMVGAVPSLAGAQATRLRDAARVPGLFVLGALGGRGLTWAPLLAQMLVAWVEGSPMPVPARLRDATDPARWRVRRARQAVIRAEMR